MAIWEWPSVAVHLDIVLTCACELIRIDQDSKCQRIKQLEGPRCKVQGADSTPDPRYTFWGRYSKRPAVAKSPSIKPPAVAQNPPKKSPTVPKNPLEKPPTLPKNPASEPPAIEKNIAGVLAEPPEPRRKQKLAHGFNGPQSVGLAASNDASTKEKCKLRQLDDERATILGLVVITKEDILVLPHLLRMLDHISAIYGSWKEE